MILKILFMNEAFVFFIFHYFPGVNVLLYIWIFMADMIIVIMFLLCWLYVNFMATNMFGSQHVFTCILMDIVSMTE